MYGPLERNKRLYEDTAAGGLKGAIRSLLCVLILIVAIAVIAHLLWGADAIGKTSQSSATISLTKAGGATQSVTVKTRIVRLPDAAALRAGAARTKQIQLPDGRWIDCRRNCADSYRSEVRF